MVHAHIRVKSPFDRANSITSTALPKRHCYPAKFESKHSQYSIIQSMQSTPTTRSSHINARANFSDCLSSLPSIRFNRRHLYVQRSPYLAIPRVSNSFHDGKRRIQSLLLALHYISLKGKAYHVKRLASAIKLSQGKSPQQVW